MMRHPHTEDSKRRISDALKRSGHRPPKMVGTTNPMWIGGKPKCAVCSKQLTNYGAMHCPKHKPSPVAGRNWKQSTEIVQKRKEKGAWDFLQTAEYREKASKIVRARVSNGSWRNQYGGYKYDRDTLKRFTGSNLERGTPQYVAWRRLVNKRDGSKCKIGNVDCSGRIEAHHILSFTAFPELRYDVANGITLCHFHHPRKKSDEEKWAKHFQSLITNN